jgi:sulfhydrogenase subunit gamma (sulfur reductase)
MTDAKWITMTVTDVHQENEHFLSIQMQPSIEGTQFEFRAGQFVKILTPGGKETYFAIASEPEEKNYVEFLVKETEEDPAREICQVKPDDQLRVSPPMGKGYPIEKLKGKNVILVGIGSGLSPLRSVLKSVLRNDQNFGKVTLVYGVKRPQDIPFIDDFNIWNQKIRVATAASQPGKAYWNGFKGRVTGLLPKIVMPFENTVACVCGNKEMQQEVSALLQDLGVPKDDILFNC